MLTEREIEKIREVLEKGGLVGVRVSPEYFKEGDYTHWYDRYCDSNSKGVSCSYSEFIDSVVMAEMEDYDYLVLYSNGTVYGIKGDLTYHISYNDFRYHRGFDGLSEAEIFMELIKKYGYEVEDGFENRRKPSM